MAPSARSDVCLKENMTLADRLYNLQLIQEFCKENLSSCCHFSLEDMLYASSTIKVLGGDSAADSKQRRHAQCEISRFAAQVQKLVIDCISRALVQACPS